MKYFSEFIGIKEEDLNSKINNTRILLREMEDLKFFGVLREKIDKMEKEINRLKICPGTVIIYNRYGRKLKIVYRDIVIRKPFNFTIQLLCWRSEGNILYPYYLGESDIGFIYPFVGRKKKKTITFEM